MVVLGQKLPIHPWLVVEALEMGFGSELYKIVITCLIFGQQNEVVRIFVGSFP
jgi:hypothetical protein